MIGQTLNNRHKIDSRLGEGGMGEVYLASDEKTGGQVAIKILARQLTANPEALERFKREGETLRQLDHPNIVKFIDAFEHEKQYVIVMEYISGGSLQNLIKQGALPIEQARQITLDLCDALIRAHRLNIIHRDLKPENILITENGTPKLADFGVARLSESTSLTRSGTQVGTPYYMAPEAWEGKILDAQADIWSLGIILFEMLAGKVPFGGETGAAVMNKVLTTQPPDLRKLRSEIPNHLTRIIRRMLTRDKKYRYPTMREVAVELEREQQTSSIMVKKTLSNNKKKPSTMPWRWILFGSIAILLLAVVYVFNESPNAPAITATSTTIDTTPTSQNNLTITNIPDPLDSGMILFECNNDLCVQPNDRSNQTPLGLSKDFTGFEGFTWSPDGDEVIFSACPTGIQDSGCSLYTLEVEQAPPALLYDYSGFTDNWPAWSPDGKWIAFGSRGDLTIIRPDKSEKFKLMTHNNETCVDKIAWSPDSQKIAWIGGRCLKGDWLFNNVWVMDSDGSNVTRLFEGESNLNQLAWSLDTKYILAEFDNGEIVTLNPLCVDATQCNVTPELYLEPFPEHWLNTFYPQWAVEDQSTATPISGDTNVYLADLTPLSNKVGFSSLGIGLYPFSEGPWVDGATIKANGVAYPHAIFSHAPSQLVYSLDDAYSSFVSDIFIDGYDKCSGAAQFIVMVDGTEVYRSERLEYQYPSVEIIKVEVDVSGGKELTLITDSLGTNYCDVTIWGDPYLDR